MDNLYLDYFFFFVPNRLIWDNWEKFCGSQANPADTIDYTIPTKVIGNNVAQNSSIYDYMGLQTNDTAQSLGQYTLPNVLPFRAYALIWNEWFRDENLQNSVTVSTADGPDTTTSATLLKRNKKHDYFTSCLPWPQKGDEVTIPMGSTAPVVSNAADIQIRGTTGAMSKLYVATNNSPNEVIRNVTSTSGGSTAYMNFGALGTTTTGLQADLSSATAATINELREALMITSLLELDARGGTRYTEVILNHFNVHTGDHRVQRPEYLGGGREKINSHIVPQTAPTSGTSYKGSLAAFATASTSDNSIGFTKSFVEHGYVIGMVSARADITYQQGIERMWLRQTRYDFFWPKLQQLGEQTVELGEIYWASDAAATNDDVFGYQERYAEYRYKPSQVTGKFRSQYATPLDMWHMAEEFGSAPALNSSFIASNTPIERALAVTTEADIIADMWFDYKHARPMTAYAIPATLGRF